jgi:hypothetical protein
MLLPNTPNTPSTFNGTNVSKFLKRYYDMTVDCDLDEGEMAKRLPKYCEYTITGPFIESMEIWDRRDWKNLKEAMLKEYEEYDHAQKLRNMAYLKTQFRNKKWQNENDINGYCRQYKIISDPLVRRGKLSRNQKI